jgi:hypothetical protein
MNIRKVKQGAKITYYNGIYQIILGVYYILFFDFNIRRSFKAISELWGFFERYNSNIASLIYFLNILIGIFLISTGITTMYLSDFIIKRKEKMTWVVLFISGLVSWGGLVVISFFLKNYYFMGAVFLGWFTFIFGMLYPIRYYLEKGYREY